METSEEDRASEHPLRHLQTGVYAMNGMHYRTWVRKWRRHSHSLYVRSVHASSVHYLSRPAAQMIRVIPITAGGVEMNP